MNLEGIEQAVNDEIKKQLRVEVEKSIEEAKERLNRRIPDIVAAVAIKTHQFVSVERCGESLAILVKLDGTL